MIPLSREIAKFLDLLKFRHEDSVVSLKDVKVVLKAPYEIHKICPYLFTHGKYAWARNMDSIKF